MHRNYKSGIYYNNKIRYTQLNNTKTKEINLTTNLTDMTTLNIKTKKNYKGLEKYKNKFIINDY